MTHSTSAIRIKPRNFNPSRAIKIFCFALIFLSCGSDWEDQMRNGNRHYADRDFRSAEIAFNSALRKKSDDAITNFNLGTAFYQNDNFRSATKHFHKAINSQNRSHRQNAFYNLGNAQFQLGKYREAIAAYRSALNIDPNNHDAQHNLELAQKRLRENETNSPFQNSGSDQSEPMINSEASQLLKKFENEDGKIRSKIWQNRNRRDPRRDDLPDW